MSLYCSPKSLYAVKQNSVEEKKLDNSVDRKLSMTSQKRESIVEKLSEKVELDKNGVKVKKVELLEKKPAVGGEAFFKVQLKPTKKVQVEKIDEKKKVRVSPFVMRIFMGLELDGARMTINVFQFCLNKCSCVNILQ